MKCRSLLFALILLVPTALFAQGPITIGVSFPYLWHPFHAGMKSAVEKAAVGLGVKVVVMGTNDPSGQALSLQDFVTQKVDGLLITPIEQDSIVPALEKVIAAGIPVVTVDRRANSDKVVAHIGSDDLEGGRIAARYIIEKLGNKGGVLELEGPRGLSVSTERKKGFDEEIGKSQVKLLASETANFDPTIASMVTAKLIKVHPDFGAIFAATDDMIEGAIAAMVEAGIDPSTKVTVGWDASASGMDFIRQGKLGASINSFPNEQARKSLAVLVEYIKSKTKPEGTVINIAPKLVTTAQ